MAFVFENLQVYQNAVDFTDGVASLTESFPRGYGLPPHELHLAPLEAG
jgi:hypothetical protein